ncbi:MAG TPA: hypothetical protein VD731_05765 [Nitrosopumilaceae archaeon]|nr:hypothetical protein [Nitrosopumilaceae archaeon]
MNPPRISFSFLSSFLQLAESFRIFVITSIISVYGLVLYELFPELIFDINNAVFYFFIPVTILAGIGIALPRYMPIIMEKIFKIQITKTTHIAETEQGDDILNELVTEGSSQQLLQSDSNNLLSGESSNLSEIGNKELDDIISGAIKKEHLDPNTVGIDPTSLADGSKNDFGIQGVQDLVDQKFEPVEKDLASFKKDLNKIKEDMKVTKDSVDTLTESFEGTLTDMKAFQAEISNPLNFMRKYFESLDLKILQDPSLPLRQQLQDNSVPIREENEKETILIPTGAGGQKVQAEPSQLSLTKSDEKSTSNLPDSGNPMDSVMKPLFSGNLSVGKMMSIIELAGDLLKEQGDDCIDLLIEQCKLMGLKTEDENTIYNIIDMLKNSGMKVEDSLIQLYKFSKIVGLTDREADAHYSKLLSARNRKKFGKGE